MYQSSYDNSIPCDLHGAAIDSLEWYLSDQNGDPIDLQGSSVQASIRVFWEAPPEPVLGEAGPAEEEIRDVAFGRPPFAQQRDPYSPY